MRSLARERFPRGGSRLCPVKEPLEPRSRHSPLTAEMDGRRELSRPAESIQRFAVDSEELGRRGDAEEVGGRRRSALDGSGFRHGPSREAGRSVAACPLSRPGFQVRVCCRIIVVTTVSCRKGVVGVEVEGEEQALVGYG
jgi:hypothetical protein